MTPITERRWYRMLLLGFAIGGTLAGLYLLMLRLGAPEGEAPPSHTLFGIGASVSMLWSLFMLRRSGRIALALVAASVLLLVGSIVALSTAHR